MGNTWTLSFLFEAAFFQRRLALFYIPFLIATICSFLVAYAFCNFFSRRLELDVCVCVGGGWGVGVFRPAVLKKELDIKVLYCVTLYSILGNFLLLLSS